MRMLLYSKSIAMDQKKDQLITKRVLEETLKERMGMLENKLEKKFDKLLNVFREYRDEVLNRMDKDASELEQIREDQVFLHHDIKNHEERIVKLEAVKTA